MKIIKILKEAFQAYVEFEKAMLQMEMVMGKVKRCSACGGTKETGHQRFCEKGHKIYDKRLKRKQKTLKKKKIETLGVKLGYVRAIKALKRIAKDYKLVLGKDTNKLMKDIIKDFEYCVDKTERFNKIEEIKHLFQEAFTEPEIEGACPFCKSIEVQQYEDEVEYAGVLLMNKCMKCKKEWQ